MLEINRRSLITGLVSFIAAPAIVRVSSIMPVKLIDLIDPTTAEILCLPDQIATLLVRLQAGDGTWINFVEAMEASKLTLGAVLPEVAGS